MSGSGVLYVGDRVMYGDAHIVPDDGPWPARVRRHLAYGVVVEFEGDPPRGHCKVETVAYCKVRRVAPFTTTEATA